MHLFQCLSSFLLKFGWIVLWIICISTYSSSIWKRKGGEGVLADSSTYTSVFGLRIARLHWMTLERTTKTRPPEENTQDFLNYHLQSEIMDETDNSHLSQKADPLQRHNEKVFRQEAIQGPWSSDPGHSAW